MQNDLDVRITYYNNAQETPYADRVNSHICGYTVTNNAQNMFDFFFVKRIPEIAIILSPHLRMTNGDIGDLIRELSDTLIHELIHAIGDWHTENYVNATVKCMMYSTNTWFTTYLYDGTISATPLYQVINID